MTLAKSLYPFQRDGAGFLAGREHAYLADPMGLGKSVQAATAAKAVRVENVLIVAPATALENWRREWMEWGPKRARLEVVSWASPRLPELVTRAHEFDLVIPDEAHRAKNPGAKRTRLALDISRRSTYAWPLSGTPMPNHPGELYPVIRVLWPDLVPRVQVAKGVTRPMKYEEWFDHFCFWRLTPYGKRPYAIKNAPQLKSILSQFMLRRSYEEVGIQLPPLRVDVSLLRRDASLRDALARSYGGRIDVEDLEARIEAEEEHPCPDCETFEEQGACRTCGGEGVISEGSQSRLRRLLGAYKAPLIAEQLAEELRAGEYTKIVVMAYHRATLALLRNELRGFGVSGFDGSTPLRLRQAAIDTFQTDPGCRVFIVQQTAAQEAINLQAASEIVLVEPSWTGDDNWQAIKRVHRIGSERPVRARVFAIADSLDEAVMQAVATKTRMQADVGLLI